jgi:hypothetical protein
MSAIRWQEAGALEQYALAPARATSSGKPRPGRLRFY